MVAIEPPDEISEADLAALREALAPLVGQSISWLAVPQKALAGFEPSQLSVIANTLADAALPQIELMALDEDGREKLRRLGLEKAPRSIGEREGYPDYVHAPSGKRVELKGLFVDNPDLDIKRPPTQREPSARLKEQVTQAGIQPANDVLLVAAIRIEKVNGVCSPVIVDLGTFSMVETLRARDDRLAAGGGKWVDGRPNVVAKKSMAKFRAGEVLGEKDFKPDTNFGKLARIPHPPLVEFLARHGAITQSKTRRILSRQDNGASGKG